MQNVKINYVYFEQGGKIMMIIQFHQSKLDTFKFLGIFSRRNPGLYILCGLLTQKLFAPS